MRVEAVLLIASLRRDGVGRESRRKGLKINSDPGKGALSEPSRRGHLAGQGGHPCGCQSHSVLLSGGILFAFSFTQQTLAENLLGTDPVEISPRDPQLTVKVLHCSVGS